jgi:hypothetical protein
MEEDMTVTASLWNQTPLAGMQGHMWTEILEQ